MPPEHHPWCDPTCPVGLPTEAAAADAHRGHVRQVIVGGVKVGTVWITQNGGPPMVACRVQRELSADAAEAFADALRDVATIRRSLS